MRIVYCIIGTFNSGGMERVLANKANFLAEHGHDIFIVTTDQRDRKPYFELNDAISHYDLAINYTDYADRSFLLKSVTYFIKQRKHYQRLSVLLSQLKADLVISMFDPEVTFLFKIKDGSKKLLEVHFSRFKRLQYGRKGLWGWADRLQSERDFFIARQYDRFVVLTQEDKLYWGNLNNIEVIPNANSFKPKSSADLSTMQVIAVGRYDYQKSFDELIRAWMHVYQVHPGWSLRIFGQGPLNYSLQTLIYDLGLQEVVMLCGPVKDMEKEYLSSSILAMTSRYEGLPMVLLEGQACGLPLVSYACKCGPRDVIQDGENGFLLPEGDQEGLANKLITLMDNIRLREQMGEVSRRFSFNFSEEKIMPQWLSLFKQVLNNS